MKSLPENVSEYKRTKTFTERTIPKGLLSEHQTLEDVWGKIVVSRGRLLYVISTGEEHVLNAELSGIVEPQVTHYVRPMDLEEVEFHVEFYRA